MTDKLPNWYGQAWQRRKELSRKQESQGSLSGGESKELKEIRHEQDKAVRKLSGIKKGIPIVHKRGRK